MDKYDDHDMYGSDEEYLRFKIYKIVNYIEVFHAE